MAINAQVYSPVPMQRFVVINMKRYNEGQNTAEGVSIVLLAAVLGTWIGLVPSRGWGQIGEGRAVPRETYFLALRAYYAGEYREALRGIRDAGRGGIRTARGPWIDGICYYTMVGECLYRLGDLPGSLTQHESALRLFLAHRGWMKRIQFPPAIGAATVAVRIPWGPVSRPSLPAQFPDTMHSLQGTDPERVVRQGGTYVAPELYPVHVAEILRCVAVSPARRRELIGPLGRQDALASDLVAELGRRNLPPGHWAQPLVRVASWCGCTLHPDKIMPEPPP